MAVDLNSRAATLSPDVRFAPTAAADSIIYTARTASVRSLVLHLVSALRGPSTNDGPATLRLGGDDEALMPQRDSQGTLVFLHDAASVGGRAAEPVAVFAVFGEQGDRDVRWFWTDSSPVAVLGGLGTVGVIEEGGLKELMAPEKAKRIPGRPTKWERVYTFIATAFTKAISFPHSTEYAQAMQITDYCPSILPTESTAACRIIEANDYLQFNGHTGRDLDDDRYLLELEPAERMVASIVSMKCAQYLLFKRQYFKAYARDCILESEKVRRGVRRDSVTTAVDAHTSTTPPATSTPPVFDTSSPAPTESVRGVGSTRGGPRCRGTPIVPNTSSPVPAENSRGTGNTRG